MNTDKWIKENTESLKGKTVMITGSTGGLGRELCFYLVSLGAELITLDRNPQKANALRKEILAKEKGAKITSFFADFEKIEELRSVIPELKKLKIDYLILNSGAYAIPRKITSEGFDNVFTINFIAPFLLVGELLENLRKNNGRVVAVGSIAHNYSKADFEDIDFKTRKPSGKVYGNAKRWLMFSLYELFEEEKLASLSVVHPGIAFTGITNHYPKLIFAVIKHPMKIIFMSPKKACLSILKGMFSETPKGFWIGPKIFNVWGNPKYKKLASFMPSESEKMKELCKSIFIK